MRRRALLSAVTSSVVVGVTGCAGLETRSAGAPSLADYRPNAVYVPTHVDRMERVGTASDGRYECILTYTAPHRFWLVTGTRRERVRVEDDDAVQLMPIVRDAQTGIVPPDVNPRVSASGADRAGTTLSPWPMLAQRIGFHFGDNVVLDGGGTYTVRVEVGKPSGRRTGTLTNPGSASFSFELEYSQTAVDELSYRETADDRVGTEGAVDPAGMAAGSQVPAATDLPGRTLGTGRSGDARFVVVAVDDAERFGAGGSETYLTVSPRTPHSGYMLPAMSLSAQLERSGETVYDGALRATTDTAFHHHYGAVVDSVEAGDSLTVTVDQPPQIARHEGYETAFLEMDPVELTIGEARSGS